MAHSTDRKLSFSPLSFSLPFIEDRDIITNLASPVQQSDDSIENQKLVPQCFLWPRDALFFSANRDIDV